MQVGVCGRKGTGFRLAVAFYLIPFGLFAQGLVNFRNNVLLSQPYDVRIYSVDGSPLVGTNFVAQLYYGSSVWTLQPTTGSPAPFRNVTTGNSLAGTWSGTFRTLLGFSPGTVVTMAVKFWDSRYGSTPEEAVRNGSYGFGVQPFTYTIPPTGTLDPTNYYMYNFRSCSALGCCPSVPGPNLQTHPKSQTVAAGSDVILSAGGHTPCFGEWRFNTTNSAGPGRWVGGGSSNYLFLTNVQASHSGDYQFVVGNYGGFATSEVAVLTVAARPQLTSPTRSGTEFRFGVLGENGHLFVVETTTDLTNPTLWLPVHTNTAPFSFTNTAVPADRQRFYRALLK